MNIDGLSEATLEKFIARGLIHHYADMFHLEEHRDIIVEMEGFGERSYQKLTESIERARDTTLPRLIYSLGIENIGLANAKVICRAFSYDLEEMMCADVEQLDEIDGIGSVIAASFHDYFADEKKKKELCLLLPELRIAREAVPEHEMTLQGMVIVITGSLQLFENRNALKEEIEKRGGKVTGSVSAKTTILINNDTRSASSKNKKARELNIPVISEAEFRQRYLQM